MKKKTFTLGKVNQTVRSFFQNVKVALGYARGRTVTNEEVLFFSLRCADRSLESELFDVEEMMEEKRE